MMGAGWALRVVVALVAGATLAACSAERDAIDRAVLAEREWAAWSERPSTVEGPLTLERAVALALERSLELGLVRREAEIAREVLTSSRLAMMPSLLATADQSWVSERRISSSTSATTGRPSLEESFSSERDSFTGSVELAWSVLDFGVAFFRARQAGDRRDIVAQDLRRVAQKVALDATRAYCRAAANEGAVSAVVGLLKELEARQAAVARQVAERTISERAGLQYEDSLVSIRIRLQELRAEQREVRLQLADLLALAPGAELEFAPVEATVDPGELAGTLPALGQEALASRPELVAQDAQERIAVDEVHARIAQLFPSPVATLGLEYDNNPFLRHQSWLRAGVRVSWDLLRLPQRVSEVGEARDARELVRERRTMMAMGILAQLELAAIGYQSAREAWRLAQEQASLRARLLTATRKEQESGKLEPGAVLEAESSALFAQLRARFAYADLLHARARIDNTVGRDPAGTPAPAATPGPP